MPTELELRDFQVRCENVLHNIKSLYYLEPSNRVWVTVFSIFIIENLKKEKEPLIAFDQLITVLNTIFNEKEIENDSNT